MNIRKLRVESLEERALLAVVAGGFEQAAELVAPTEATTWVVNTLDDPSEWDISDEILSLREAIRQSNQGDTIIFDASLENGTITLNGKALDIWNKLTIDASGIGGITINANGKSRVLSVKAGTLDAPTVLKGLTITGGRLSNRAGAGISVNSCVVAITNCNIIGNTGTGICVDTAGATLTNCIVAENTTNEYGGGIENVQRSSLSLINCVISGNTAKDGGGISNGYACYMDMTNCTIYGNTADSGPAIYNAGTCYIYNDIIIGDVYNYHSTDNYRITAYNTLSNYMEWNESHNCIAYDPSKPLFVDAENCNYSLVTNSQAVNAGINRFVTTEIDLAGNARIVDDVVDLGAYEWHREDISTVVTTLEDIVDAGDGLISLREAVTLYAKDGDTITFDSTLADGTIALNGGHIEVSKGIIIDASGIGGITIDGNGKSRVLYVSGGTEDFPVELINLTITGGNVSDGVGAGILNSGNHKLINCTIVGNSANYGGGIYNNRGTQALIGCTISENTASWGGGIFNNYGTMAITETEISGNLAGSGGGGINNDGTITVTDSAISGNSSNLGGGIYTSVIITVSNSSVYGNTANNTGGGIINYGTATIISSTVSNNISNSSGGIYNGWNLTVTNSVISENSANYSGGGINNGSTLTISNSTISKNYAGYGGGLYNSGVSSATYLYNNIIAQNTAYSAMNDVYLNSGSLYAYNTLSTFSDWTESTDCLIYNSALPLFTDIENSDFTLAYASQAFNVGNNDYATTDFDTAGNPRIISGIVDLGAYEYDSSLQPEQLATPTILSGTKDNYVSYGTNRHQIVWDEIENAFDYELAYSADGGETWTSVITSETGIIITKLNYGEDVTYRVRALRNGLFLTSDWSAEKTFNVCPMDINGDGDISGPDRLILSSAWLAEEGDSRYQYYCDLDGDGNVANRDRLALSVNWLMEAGQEGLLYPRPLAADAVFAEFESADISFDPDTF